MISQIISKGDINRELYYNNGLIKTLADRNILFWYTLENILPCYMTKLPDCRHVKEHTGTNKREMLACEHLGLYS